MFYGFEQTFKNFTSLEQAS
ncbi:hypothetical protein [Lactobacillus kimbladii]